MIIMRAMAYDMTGKQLLVVTWMNEMQVDISVYIRGFDLWYRSRLLVLLILCVTTTLILIAFDLKTAVSLVSPSVRMQLTEMFMKAL